MSCPYKILKKKTTSCEIRLMYSTRNTVDVKFSDKNFINYNTTSEKNKGIKERLKKKKYVLLQV